MTKWKTQEVAVIREMLEHHQVSRWHNAVLDAAASLGLPVASRTVRYRTCAGDFAWAREWYVPAAALARAGVGGIDGVHVRANTLLDERLGAFAY